ncbi:MAG: Peptidyl-prolyl cis-trans isomerase B [Candidatus Magasanikbacteria bacterium GW2011_GWD2_43_18]|uniref:Peptidyl-prolyl cis-trans isomerase B n=1 Tax=Candidatus Magasanikbacteria bacterium GW2011_GWE2_42_7 TaxID=1619052 RepID=A0A0G1BEI5_9BACT|nr:MAG: Peptidyl-prolyl cis-trans isomerase B [Candidatus Magasanikbacteria bacterium GW2011_GWC2_42_27]KKS71790.1 MAG: Peptidyl-prolyl cis-trans isomerase B [Candidatus Magasanikbacteria bacterium GW2011_GWE2_42_7]KKT04209.1 MAG: Peptidyl-prolyl cis-trans isomerase B [Candidatus Magasanikbacteria bacterium GW2011_GWD2_43_18]KKT25903.1 MAG: Peptidyl-prolyl cis-trans isomerase B [Candidatus Magasanikbacteria bacterium GW2011_GWA2_43_9]HBB37880.1 protein-disulfide isomerase [Candidatus Magasanikb
MTQSTKSILLWGTVILGTIGLVWLLASLGSGSTDSPQSLSDGITDTDQVKGTRNAQVTLVEYSDFQCPACSTVYPLLKQLSQEFPDTLAVVYRHYPLRSIHPNAQLSAQAAEAAGLQNNFWEMHDVLFNTQSQWSSLLNPTDFFVQLATSLGLNTEQFKTDLTSSAVEAVVNDSYARATSMNLPGTPSFFLNGESIQNPGSYAGFKSLIESALSAT